ncbi:MAG: ACT domain-containing protein, partial [Thermoanaerobaculia bacterium]|nr:ACT domain-containing protein [Thermoanaerobaculia bacterium]
AVGRIGTLLGEAGINIADIHLARKEATREALSVLRVDESPSAAVMARLAGLEAIRSARAVDLGGA